MAASRKLFFALGAGLLAAAGLAARTDAPTAPWSGERSTDAAAFAASAKESSPSTEPAAPAPSDAERRAPTFRMAANQTTPPLGLVHSDDLLAEPRDRIRILPRTTQQEISFVLNEHGLRALALGRPTTAGRYFEAAWAMMRGAPPPKAEALARLRANAAQARAAAGDLEAAAVQSGAALRLSRAFLAERDPFRLALAQQLEPILVVARSRAAGLEPGSIGADAAADRGFESLRSAAAFGARSRAARDGAPSPALFERAAIQPAAGPLAADPLPTRRPSPAAPSPDAASPEPASPEPANLEPASPPESERRTRDRPASDEAETPTAAGTYVLHIASMRSLERARRAWAVFAQRHPDALRGLRPLEPEPVDLPGRGRFYRVLGGAFASVADAERRCVALRERGEYCVVAPR